MGWCRDILKFAGAAQYRTEIPGQFDRTAIRRRSSISKGNRRRYFRRRRTESGIFWWRSICWPSQWHTRPCHCFECKTLLLACPIEPEYVKMKNRRFINTFNNWQQMQMQFTDLLLFRLFGGWTIGGLERFLGGGRGNGGTKFSSSELASDSRRSILTWPLDFGVPGRFGPGFGARILTYLDAVPLPFASIKTLRTFVLAAFFRFGGAVGDLSLTNLTCGWNDSSPSLSTRCCVMSRACNTKWKLMHSNCIQFRLRCTKRTHSLALFCIHSAVSSFQFGDQSNNYFCSNKNTERINDKFRKWRFQHRSSLIELPNCQNVFGALDWFFVSSEHVLTCAQVTCVIHIWLDGVGNAHGECGENAIDQSHERDLVNQFNLIERCDAIF